MEGVQRVHTPLGVYPCTPDIPLYPFRVSLLMENPTFQTGDFETITNELIHIPYMVCNSETEPEYGEMCALQMLFNIPVKMTPSLTKMIFLQVL